MPETDWLHRTSPAFRLMIATSWLAPDSFENNQEKAIREAIAAMPDWTEYLSLVVDRHRTPALSWAALSRIPALAIPESARRDLKKSSDTCRMRAVKHCLLFAEVLACFNRDGIPVMTLKGPVLSLELYGDAGLRQSKDLDLAVQPKDLPRAKACLAVLGWNLDSPWSPVTPRQWEMFLHHDSHFNFVHPRTGCVLELHWRNQWDTPIDIAERWAKSTPFHWQGCSFQIMSPGDSALYLCSHGARHFWSRAKWLGDLARLHATGRADWDVALWMAHRTGDERVLLSSLQLLELVYGLPLPVSLRHERSDVLPALTSIPLDALKSPKDAAGAFLGEFGYRFRLGRYERLLWPRKSWRESLSEFWYQPEDFGAIQLPDSFFWAYIPLRPFLWAWRAARKLGSRIQSTPAARA